MHWNLETTALLVRAGVLVYSKWQEGRPDCHASLNVDAKTAPHERRKTGCHWWGRFGRNHHVYPDWDSLSFIKMRFFHWLCPTCIESANGKMIVARSGRFGEGKIVPSCGVRC